MKPFKRLKLSLWCSACLALAVGLASPLSAAPNQEAAHDAQPQKPSAVWRTDATTNVAQTLDLISLVPGGQATAIKLTGATPTQYFDFGVRADEIISSAVLELDYTASPSLLPALAWMIWR